jgi:hypothetical protein
MQRTEFEAGPNQAIVIYTSDDTGTDAAPAAVYSAVATDAGNWAATGWHIVSTTAIPVRQLIYMMAREGTVHQTTMSVVVVYARQ